LTDVMGQASSLPAEELAAKPPPSSQPFEKGIVTGRDRATSVPLAESPAGSSQFTRLEYLLYCYG
jgi:hypothetical protein